MFFFSFFYDLNFFKQDIKSDKTIHTDTDTDALSFTCEVYGIYMVYNAEFHFEVLQ